MQECHSQGKYDLCGKNQPGHLICWRKKNHARGQKVGAHIRRSENGRTD